MQAKLPAFFYFHMCMCVTLAFSYALHVIYPLHFINQHLRLGYLPTCSSIRCFDVS